MKRVNILAILANPDRRAKLLAGAVRFLIKIGRTT